MMRFLERAWSGIQSWYYRSFLHRLVTRLIKVVVWPFAMLWRLATGLLDSLDQFSLDGVFHLAERVLQKPMDRLKSWHRGSKVARWQRLLLAPIAGLGWLVDKGLGLLGQVMQMETPELVPDSVVKRKEELTGSFGKWCARHEVGTWLKISPALLGFLGWMILAGVVYYETPQRIEARYTRWADDAQKMSNFPRARVASERLMQLDSTNRLAHMMRLAKSLAAMGFTDEAVALATKATTIGAEGYTPARVFIAESIINNPASLPEALKEAERYLVRAIHVDSDNADVQALLGLYHFRTGDWEEAKWYLKRAYPKRNEVAFTLCGIELSMGNELACVRWAEAAATHYRNKCLKEPLDYQSRLRWAESVLVQAKYTNALDILHEGIAKTGHKAYHRMAASIYADLLKRAYVTDPTNLVEFVRLATTGLSDDPQNEFLMSQTVMLSQVPGDAGTKALLMLRELSTKGKDIQANIKLYQALDAYRRNDLAKARIAMDAAYAAKPENLAIANNFAWMLAISEPPEMARALGIISDLIKGNPQVPVFRETRGQIYAKMGRWQDAATDLENAKKTFSNSTALFETLAQVYDQLGKADQSAEARRQLDRLKLRQQKNWDQ